MIETEPRLASSSGVLTAPLENSSVENGASPKGKPAPAKEPTVPLLTLNPEKPNEPTRLLAPPLRDEIGSEYFDDSDSSEDEGMADYKVGGYHAVHVGEVFNGRYIAI